MYLQLLDKEVIWTVSTYNTWKIDKMWVTIDGVDEDKK